MSLQFADGYCAALTQKETLKGVNLKGAQKGTDRGNWLEPSSVDLATPLKCTTVHEIAAKYMWGNLCGITSRSISGFPSTLGIAAAQIQKHAGWGVDEKTDPDKGTGNDGIVPYNSCVYVRALDFFRVLNMNAQLSVALYVCMCFALPQTAASASPTSSGPPPLLSSR